MPIDLPPALTKKIGPLPVWAWGAVVLGLIGVYLYSRSRPPKGADIVPLSGPDEGMVTADSGASFEGLTGGGVGNIGNGTGGSYQDSGGYYPPGPSFLDSSPVFEASPPIFEPSPVSSPTIIQAPTTTVAATKQTSFVWSGKTYTRGDLAAFRAVLKKSGVTYSHWATLHPKAAREVFGTMV
jgi:hypothetical protein